MSEDYRGVERRHLEAVISRVDRTIKRVGDEFPYYADPETGEWVTTPDGDWCAGHWIGLLWFAANYSETPQRYEETARRFLSTAIDAMPATSMFRGLTCNYAGFRGYDRTGDRNLQAIGLTGADQMVALYDHRARQIPLGEFRLRGPDNFRGVATDDKPSGLSIGAVDNIYTAVPILWRAYEATGETTFRDIAVSHADRHLDWYIRPDGSTWHHAVFDPETGDLEYQYNELAHSNESCWARGQGWNIAGLALAYNATRAERYLTALETTTDYYIEHAPADRIPFWDFQDPDIPSAPRDTSAAALAAYGLLSLADENDTTTALHQTGGAILSSLVNDYMILDAADDRYGMVTASCFNKPGEYLTEHETVWTDYYVAAAIDAYATRMQSGIRDQSANSVLA